MKILQINTFCGTGSTGRIAADIAETLQSKGHESLIAYGIGENPNNNVNAIKIESNLEIHIHSMLSQLFDWQGRGSKHATKRLIKRIKEYDPEVIHLHNLHGCYINVKTLFNYFKKYNKKVIWTLHDCWAFTGHCTHFDYARCEKWRTECKDCIQRREYPKNIFLSRTKANYNLKKNTFTGCQDLTIVTPSRWLQNLVQQSFLKDYNVKVINNGIDLEKFKPIYSDIREKFKLKNKFIILGVAYNWTEKKGLNYFIELSKKIDDNFAIILIGITEEQKTKMPNNIITIAKTDNIEELAKFYTIADVFVNPTLEETFSLVNIEALACGTPVITFNTGGSPESINSRCGIVVEKGNTQELYEAIIKLKNSNLKSEDCIERAKEYNKQNKYEEYIELYMS